MPRCYVNIIRNVCFTNLNRALVLPELASQSSKPRDVNYSASAKGNTQETEPANNKALWFTVRRLHSPDMTTLIKRFCINCEYCTTSTEYCMINMSDGFGDVWRRYCSFEETEENTGKYVAVYFSSEIPIGHLPQCNFTPYRFVEVKQNCPANVMQATRERRALSLLVLDLGTRRVWFVSVTSRPRFTPCTHWMV
jgi:hypothetical protein